MYSNTFHIDGEIYDNPMTMFDRRKMVQKGLSVDEAINLIRHGIRGNATFLTIYQSILANASLPKPNDDGSGHDKVSALARWAKNNAFVYIIGLNASGLYMDVADPTWATRRQFRTNALAAFQELTVDVPGESCQPLRQ